MDQSRLLYSLAVFTLTSSLCCAFPQATSPIVEQAPYRLSVSVDEVVLTFHASGTDGLPVNDLRVDDLTLLDNGKRPQKILDFGMRQDLPIRAAILVDASDSMQGNLSQNRGIATEYVSRFLRQPGDQGLAVGFGRGSQTAGSWTGDAKRLIADIQAISMSGEGQARGTAIFDTIFRTCLYQFGKADHGMSGNLILLFSDGEDNASSVYLRDAVDMCQRTNTAIYAFRAEKESGPASTGPGTLAELTSQTGGRVFHGDDSQEAIDRDLRTIDADLRNQYRLVYRPAGFKQNGAFHRIVVLGPARVKEIVVRSGYYAPTP